jgi:hypothetical protein
VEPLRIIVAGPPKAGNVWVDHLLAGAYGLTVIDEVAAGQAEDLLRYHRNGRFLPNSVFHQHFWATDELIDAVRSIGAHLVTVLRDPYDMFVSFYHYVQRFPDGFVRNAEPAAAIIGKDIGHADVLAFLAQEYGRDLANALAWCERPDATIELRYERLQADTARELRRATDRIRPVGPDVLDAAVHAARADAVRQIRPGLERHIRYARTGDWRNHLGPAHLEVFRREHGDAVRRLGYPVR